MKGPSVRWVFYDGVDTKSTALGDSHQSETDSHQAPLTIYIYMCVCVYVYVFQQYMVYTNTLGEFVADQMQMNLECAQYLWESY